MRRETLALIVVIVILGVLVYSYGQSIAPEGVMTTNTAPAAVEVPFTKIVQGLQSSVERRVNYLVTSDEGLQELWKIVHATSTPPSVDFSKEAVVAVFAGMKPTTGYSIGVIKITDVEKKRLVTVELAEPAPTCITAQHLTAPYEVLTVPVTSLPFSHEDTTAMTNCSE